MRRTFTSHSNFFSWEVPDKPISIELHRNLMERLDREVMESFNSLPKRGVEVGGLLLGKAHSNDRLTINIEGYEAVPCEHRRGPSYLLSDSDRARLEKTIAAWRSNPNKQVSVIGCYRSQTRDDFTLDEEDISLFKAHFSDPASVFLLIKPVRSGDNSARLYFWEHGGIEKETGYLQIPFSQNHAIKAALSANPSDSVEEIPAESQPSAQGTRSEPAPLLAEQAEEPEAALDTARTEASPEIDPPVTQLPPDTHTAPQPEVFSRCAEPPERRRLWIPLAGITILIAAGLFVYQAVSSFRRTPGNTTAPQFSGLGLTVDGTDETLQLKWDRNAAPVAKADRALLLITDGKFQKELTLDQIQIRTGSVIYTPSSNDVSFKLQVFGPDGAAVQDSVRVVAPPSPPSQSNNLEVPIPESLPPPEKTPPRKRARTGARAPRPKEKDGPAPLPQHPPAPSPIPDTPVARPEPRRQ